jgi:glycosyltransferase involved in cell wall biosynthesis
MRRLAFVIQRYGREVLGGAEEHCRQIVERLAPRFGVEVFTTCARDYLTWADAYPPGTCRVDGIAVHRFPVARPRRVRAFGRLSQRIFDRPHRFRDEAEWMERQGPDSPALLEALARHRDAVDLFVFFTYLYQTTFFGLPLVAGKAALVPTAHDEPPIRLGIYRSLFHLPRGIIYNTEEERAFVEASFRNSHVPNIIGGMGVDLPALPEAGPAAGTGGYLLYLGRIDIAKGCEDLLANYRRFAAARPDAPKLLLAGEVKMRLAREPRVEALGFVSEERKRELVAGALALVVPSRYESLSLVALEAWAAGTPVVALDESRVLSGHLERSGGGWLYRDAAGFDRALGELLASPEERRRRGLAGRAYVAERYTWERTVAVYGEFLERICALAAETR